MAIRDRVVLLVGGVGGAKLAVGLAEVLPPEQLTIIVNTGDDFEHLGLHVSPDLDTVMYSLAGIAGEMGWGVQDDTFEAMGMVAKLGGPDWFRLGDRDLGTNLLRSEGLRDGQTLTEMTRRLCAGLEIAHTILPMSDDPVRTMLDTDQGELAFQIYFVRERWQPVVAAIRYAGAEQARPSDQVRDALENATLIVFGPSNPVLSIAPILAVSGMREMIEQAGVPVVAVSPIIGGEAVKGPAAKLMGELGMAVSSVGIAEYYENLVKGIILDEIDLGLVPSVEHWGMRAGVMPTLMRTHRDKIQLANRLLHWTEENLS